MAQGGGIPIIAKDGSINGGMPGPKGIMPTGGKLGGSWLLSKPEMQLWLSECMSSQTDSF